LSCDADPCGDSTHLDREVVVGQGRRRRMRRAARLIREGQDLPGGFDFWSGIEAAVRRGQAEIIRAEGYGDLPPTSVSDDSKWHLDSWVDCMRAREPMTNGHELEVKGVRHPVSWACRQRTNNDGTLTLAPTTGV
jgi:hypothetical protein